jgi:ACT domain-containing protein
MINESVKRKIELIVYLPDTPGNLVELIKPVSNNNGNIFSILHDHHNKRNNMIPVSITFEIPQEIMESSLKKIQAELKEKNIKIEKITSGPKQNHLLVLLTGHVFDTDVLDTIKRLAAKGIKTSELQAKFTEISEISNVKLKLEYPDSMPEKKLMEELNKICKEKNLFLIKK